MSKSRPHAHLSTEQLNKAIKSAQQRLFRSQEKGGSTCTEDALFRTWSDLQREKRWRAALA